jgi:hypothetical protein
MNGLKAPNMHLSCAHKCPTISNWKIVSKHFLIKLFGNELVNEKRVSKRKTFDDRRCLHSYSSPGCNTLKTADSRILWACDSSLLLVTQSPWLLLLCTGLLKT